MLLCSVAKKRYQAAGFPYNRMLKLSSSRGIRIDVPVLSVSWSVVDHSVIIQALRKGLIEHEASDTGGVPRWKSSCPDRLAEATNYMYGYVGHEASAIAKPEFDQVLSRRRPSSNRAPPFGVVLARCGSLFFSLSTLPGGGSRPCSRCPPARGTRFVFGSKYRMYVPISTYGYTSL